MLDTVKNIAQEAGKIILEYRKKGFDIETKSDESPVTEADKAADAYLRKALHEAFPEDKILSEETTQDFPDFSGRVWMVDPIDGTRAFVNKEDGFCVLIGLCENGIPTLGVMYVPARDELFYAEQGKGAFLEKAGQTTQLHVSNCNNIDNARLLVGYPTEKPGPLHPFLNSLPLQRVYDGSFGTRICAIAQDRAELYPCAIIAPAKWDTCATQVILEEAGGKITLADGSALDYYQKETKWNQYLICSNGKVHDVFLNYLQPYLKE